MGSPSSSFPLLHDSQGNAPGSAAQGVPNNVASRCASAPVLPMATLGTVPLVLLAVLGPGLARVRLATLGCARIHGAIGAYVWIHGYPLSSIGVNHEGEDLLPVAQVLAVVA